jgi:hypothetical protein
MNDKQLQPGDLAIIIKSLDGLSVGKIVECVHPVGTHSLHGIIWLVQSKGNDLVSEYGAVGNHVHVAQDWLKKIPKDPLPEEDDATNLTTQDELCTH